MKISTQSLIPSKEDLLATKTSHFSTFIASELITILLELTYHFMNKCVLVQGPHEMPILPQTPRLTTSENLPPIVQQDPRPHSRILT